VSGSVYLGGAESKGKNVLTEVRTFLAGITTGGSAVDRILVVSTVASAVPSPDDHAARTFAPHRLVKIFPKTILHAVTVVRGSSGSE